MGETVGRQIGAWAQEGMEVETAPGGLVMPKGRAIEEIRVELALELN